MNTNDKSNEEALNDAFKSADLSDKVWMFFSQHRRTLALLTLAVLVLSGIIAAVIISRNIALQHLQSAYLEAMQTETREAFAQKYASAKLGGTVYLELADEAYQKKEYQKATDYYRKSLIGLGKNIFGSRAAIGEGLSLIKSGLQLEGEDVLARVVEEKAYPLSIRGNAFYLLANSTYERRDVAKAKSILHQLINSHFSDYWKDGAKALLHEIELWQ
jgi:tetratricopeptide (TPR) repeat protein